MRVAIDPGLHNLGLCCVADDASIVDWRVVDLCPTVRNPPIDRIVRAATTFVASLQLEADTNVRIEQQPAANVKMKVLCHVLQALLIARAANVSIVSPKTYKTAGGTYHRRKKDSVTRATTMVEGTPWAATFQEHAKKDDLADALLLARWPG